MLRNSLSPDLMNIAPTLIGCPVFTPNSGCEMMREADTGLTRLEV